MNTRLYFIAGLLLVLLLILAIQFPKYTIGFTLIILFMVVVTHADLITAFFSTGSETSQNH